MESLENHGAFPAGGVSQDGEEGAWPQSLSVAQVEMLDQLCLPGAAVIASFPETVNFPVEKVLPEFSQLYAAVERQMDLPDWTDSSLPEAAVGRRSYVLGVTSAVAGEGKTTTALQLALATMNNSFRRVCLIDLSLGNDELSRSVGMTPHGKGVISYLQGETRAIHGARINGSEEFVILPAGQVPANAARAARSPGLVHLFELARGLSDVIIVDLPSVASDAVLPLVQHLDGVLVVTRAGATPRDIVRRAVEPLREKVIGVVLNRVQSSIPGWLKRRL